MTITDSWLNPIASGASMSVLGYREDIEEFSHELYSFLLSSIREEDQKYTRFVYRWMQGQQDRWESIYGKILNLPMLYSPWNCPEDQLEYLKDNIGLTDDLSYLWGTLDTTEKRRILEKFVYFCAFRATVSGVPGFVEYMTGQDVRLKTFFDFRWLVSGSEVGDIETFIGRDEEGYDPWLISEANVVLGIYPDSVSIVTIGASDYYEFVIDGFVTQVESVEPPLPANIRVKYKPLNVSVMLPIFVDAGVYKVRAAADYYFGQAAPYSTSPYDFLVGVEPDPHVYDILIVDDGTLNRAMVEALAIFSRANSERIYLRYYLLIDEFEDFENWTETSGTTTYDEDEQEVSLSDVAADTIIQLSSTDALLWTEYNLSVKARSTVVEKYFEMRFAWQDAQNYFYLRVEPATPPTIPAGTWIVGQVVAGVDTALDNGTLDHYDVDVDYFWRLVWVYAGAGVTIQIYQDENLLNTCEYVDPWGGAVGTVELFSETGGEVIVSYVDVHSFPMDSTYIGP